jgi:hypothetical protein
LYSRIFQERAPLAQSAHATHPVPGHERRHRCTIGLGGVQENASEPVRPIPATQTRQRGPLFSRSPRAAMPCCWARRSPSKSTVARAQQWPPPSFKRAIPTQAATKCPLCPPSRVQPLLRDCLG